MTDRRGLAAVDVGAPTTRLTWSDALGKRVREGSWQDLAVSTAQRIEEAIAAGQWEVAAELVDYFMEEAKVCHNVYRSWSAGLEGWLAAQGVPDAELSAERGRLAALLAFPDGAPFDPDPRWLALGATAGGFAAQLRALALDEAGAMAGLAELREAWRQLHDRWVDLQSGLLTFVARRFGEAALGECYQDVLDGHLNGRYGVFDLRERSYEETVERNLYLSLEAMRGHLVGPERTGDMTLTEHEDRWVISFDPCGSGGRGQRGDAIEGTGSRSDPPYDFGVTREAHDWAWNEQGVCYYCAHCCIVNERWAAERWGAPLRVTDSPLHPGETRGDGAKPCTWTIYKTFEAIPEEAYRRIGLTKPAAPGQPALPADPSVP